MWYPGAGEVLDCIDSCSLPSSYFHKFLCLPENWPIVRFEMKTSSNVFQEVNIFDIFLISPSRELK